MARKLEVNWGELIEAFDDSSWDLRYFLDLETGEIVRITDEATRLAEDPPEEELTGWMKEAVEQADRVELGRGIRYIQIPERDTRDSYGDMKAFIGTVRNPHLQDRLWQAIGGSGAFRYFRSVLYEHPAEKKRWFAYERRCIHERVLSWLRSENIEPTSPVEPPAVPEPEDVSESAREALLEDLTLLVIYLSSWDEEVAPGHTVCRAWKGYLFEVLNALEEKGYISLTRRARSMTLTEEGVVRAQEIEARYGGM
jgi:hypothetical protein